MDDIIQKGKCMDKLHVVAVAAALGLAAATAGQAQTSAAPAGGASSSASSSQAPSPSSGAPSTSRSPSKAAPSNSSPPGVTPPEAPGTPTTPGGGVTPGSLNPSATPNAPEQRFNSQQHAPEQWLDAEQLSAGQKSQQHDAPRSHQRYASRGEQPKLQQLIAAAARAPAPEARRAKVRMQSMR